MTADRISIRVGPKLRRRLQQEASANGRRESDLVRAALEEYLARYGQAETCYQLAKRTGVIGAAKGAPPDLSTSRRHFEGFGQS